MDGFQNEMLLIKIQAFFPEKRDIKNIGLLNK
jgi:hypothetical protein